MILRLIVVIGPLCVGAEASFAAPKHAVPWVRHSLLLDGLSLGKRLIVVGERGHILISDDDGESWVQTRVPTHATLTGVYFRNSRLGWAVGHDAVILRTTDGGERWTQVYAAPREDMPLFDIWFKDANHGIAVGAYGLFLVSTDGGLNWSREPLRMLGQTGPKHHLMQFKSGPQTMRYTVDTPTAESITDLDAMDRDDFQNDFHLNRIAWSSTGRLYIAAEAGHLYRSDDIGRHWIALASPYRGSFFGVLPLDADAVLAYGLRGHLFLSRDAGQTWQRIATCTQEMLTDGLRLEDGAIVLSGLGGTVLVSLDGGVRFKLDRQPNHSGYSAIFSEANGHLITTGEYGIQSLDSMMSLKPHLTNCY